MNNKSRSGLMVIACGYVVIIGFNLVKAVVSGVTGGSPLFAVAGGLFMLFGVVGAVINIKGLLAARKETEETAENEAEEEIETIEQSE